MILKKIISKLLSRRKEILIPILENVSNTQLLEGKVALITGGSGGIGKAIAVEYIKNGCKVIIAGTNESKLKEICTELGECSRYIIINFNNIKEFDEKITLATSFFGQIDILVNSAGVHSTNKKLDFLNVSEDDYDTILDINLKGTYFICQAISNYMIKNNVSGHILNISSTTALEPAWSPYRLSKWGIKGFTVGLADKLLDHGIIVNAIAPGSTATNLLNYKDGDSIYTRDNPMRRYIMPEEIAPYAVLLVSEFGNMVVGETLYISGGRGNIVVPTYSSNK